MADEPRPGMTEPHPHDDAAVAPGATGPGQQGYEGEATLGSDDGYIGPEGPDADTVGGPLTGRSPGMEPGAKEDPIGGESPTG